MMMIGDLVSHGRLPDRIEEKTDTLIRNGTDPMHLHYLSPQMDQAEILPRLLPLQLMGKASLSPRSLTVVILRRQWDPDYFQDSFFHRI